MYLEGEQHHEECFKPTEWQDNQGAGKEMDKGMKITKQLNYPPF